MAAPLAAGGIVAGGAKIRIERLEKVNHILHEASVGGGPELARILRKVRRTNPDATMAQLASAIHEANRNGALCGNDTESPGQLLRNIRVIAREVPASATNGSKPETATTGVETAGIQNSSGNAL